jgi:hypothetical protein
MSHACVGKRLFVRHSGLHPHPLPNRMCNFALQSMNQLIVEVLRELNCKVW